MTEQEKMLAGKIYDPSDGALRHRRGQRGHPGYPCRLPGRRCPLPGDSGNHRSGRLGTSSRIILTFKIAPAPVSKGDLLIIPLPEVPPASQWLFRHRAAPLPAPGWGG